MASNPCGTCGSTERYKSGNCAPCSRVAAARYRNTEHGKIKVQEYLEKSKSLRKEYFKQYRESDRGKEVQAKYQKTDKRKAVLIRYHQTEKYRENRQRYLSTPKGKATKKKNKARRSALEFDAEGSFTPNEWIDLCDELGNKCLCCGKDDVELTVDHVIPLVKGGSNSIKNIQPLCFDCNRIKWKDCTDYRVGVMNYGLQTI